MAIVQAAMLSGQPFDVLRDAILTHPTTASGLNVLVRCHPGALNSRRILSLHPSTWRVTSWQLS
jgi:hypothetical protein